MDWSLVLLSQGIEPEIQYDPATRRWALWVEQEEVAHALRVLKQYHQENRGWWWPPSYFPGERVFHWGVLAWAGTLALMYLVSKVYFPSLWTAGMVHHEEVLNGAWWQLFTAVSLHANPTHLLLNVTSGVLLLGLCMARYGAGPALLGSYLAGVAGNILGLVCYSGPYRALGASGMVMGSLGLITYQSLAPGLIPRARRRLLFGSLMAGFMLLVLLGTDPHSDIVAHAGGFAAGLAMGPLFSFINNRFQRRSWNLICLAVCLLLFAVPWTLAIKTVIR